MEIWKDVIGFEGQYMISNYGNAKSLRRMICVGKRGERWLPEIILKPSIGQAGYARVRIGTQLTTIHRLVALHFIPNPDGKDIINHKNGVKLNNNAENLEWCTNTENQRHAWATGLKKALKGEKHASSKTSDAIRGSMIDMYRKGARMCEIAKKFGFHDDYVIKIIKKSGFYEKRPRVKNTVEEYRGYQRVYQAMWRRRKKEMAIQ
jgi:hypothetical protein